MFYKQSNLRGLKRNQFEGLNVARKKLHESMWKIMKSVSEYFNEAKYEQKIYEAYISPYTTGHIFKKLT